MFDGTLGKYTDCDYTIKLNEDTKPYHAKPFPVPITHNHFPIPIIHEPTLNKEVNKLIEIRVLKIINNSQWAAPTFIIPKNNGTVRLISDFRELN